MREVIASLTVSLSISERGDPARAGTIHGGAQIMNATASHRGSGYTAVPAEAILRAANLARARRGEERSAQAASLPWRFDADVSSSGLFKAGSVQFSSVQFSFRMRAPALHAVASLAAAAIAAAAPRRTHSPTLTGESSTDYESPER